MSITLDDNIILNNVIKKEFKGIHCLHDTETGMQAIIAIHNTNLGPSLGGCRFIHYDNHQQALNDAMKLAKGMSYKSAVANLPLGGGKAVIIKPKSHYNRTDYMQKFGKFVNSLNGEYITALDSGTQLSDMDIISQYTPYVASLSNVDGDPAPSTAMVVFRGIMAAILFKIDAENLSGIHVAIQGLGNVGFTLAKLLHDKGARLSVADVNPTLVDKAVTEFGAIPVNINDIHKVKCDVFAPCALGGIINDVTINELQTKIIAGAANNQCAHENISQQLHEKGILYAPDYVINAGGIIFAAHKYLKTSETTLAQNFDNVYDTLMKIFYQSLKTNQSTNLIANEIAEERLNGYSA